MISFLKKWLSHTDNNDKWLNEIENENFFFRKGQEAQAHQLLTENRLLDLLLGTDLSLDASATANDWIDSEEVHIRENNNFDCTIDYFLAPQPEKKMVELDDNDPAFANANDYIKAMVPTNDAMEHKLQLLKNRITTALDKLMRDCINQSRGVAFAFDVLSAINDQNKAFLLEMHDELQVTKSVNLPKEEQDLRDRCSMLAGKEGSSTSKNALLKKITKEAEDIVVCKREILRREYAIKFFLWLQRQLQSWAYTVKKTGALIDFVRQDNNMQLAQLQAENRQKGEKIGATEIEISELIDAIEGKTIFNLTNVEQTKNLVSNFVAQKIDK